MNFRDLGAQYRALQPQIDAAVARVMGSGRFILGEEVAQLEGALAAYVGRRHCIACASGTDALRLALMLHGVGPRDAVFVPDFTFIAPAEAVLLCGATPVFVDIEEDTFNLAPDALERAIRLTAREGRLRPRGVIAVDLFGLPADYARLMPIARQHGLFLIEDAAQSFGGRIGRTRAGAFGDIAATSFFPAKPLGCYGDGGAVFTDDDAQAERLRSLRAHGASPQDKYDHREVGLNSRLDAIQAAILRVKLGALDREHAAVQQAASWYDALLGGALVTPRAQALLRGMARLLVREAHGVLRPGACKPLWHARRDERAAKQRLSARGIPSMVYYPRALHQQTACRRDGAGDDRFPQAVAACRCALSLPMHPYLSREDAQAVSAAILDESLPI